MKVLLPNVEAPKETPAKYRRTVTTCICQLLRQHRAEQLSLPAWLISIKAREINAPRAGHAALSGWLLRNVVGGAHDARALLVDLVA
jgi:hypothetical protein